MGYNGDNKVIMRKRVNFASYLEYQPVLLLGHTSAFQILLSGQPNKLRVPVSPVYLLETLSS